MARAKGPRKVRRYDNAFKVKAVKLSQLPGVRVTALVVHKHGDLQPGPGFFELARRLGQTTEDIEKFWIQEVKRVFAGWAK